MIREPGPLAFRVVKRTAHMTVRVTERPTKVRAEAPATGSATPAGGSTAAPKRARGAKPKTKSVGARKKTAAKKKAVSA